MSGSISGCGSMSTRASRLKELADSRNKSAAQVKAEALVETALELADEAANRGSYQVDVSNRDLSSNDVFHIFKTTLEMQGFKVARLNRSDDLDDIVCVSWRR